MSANLSRLEQLPVLVHNQIASFLPQDGRASYRCLSKEIYNMPVSREIQLYNKRDRTTHALIKTATVCSIDNPYHTTSKISSRFCYGMGLFQAVTGSPGTALFAAISGSWTSYIVKTRVSRDAKCATALFTAWLTGIVLSASRSRPLGLFYVAMQIYNLYRMCKTLRD